MVALMQCLTENPKIMHEPVRTEDFSPYAKERNKSDKSLTTNLIRDDSEVFGQILCNLLIESTLFNDLSAESSNEVSHTSPTSGVS